MATYIGQSVSGDFWHHCDAALGARGALVTAWERVTALTDRLRVEGAEERMRQRLAAFAARSQARGDGCELAAMVVDGLADDVPVLHVAVPVGVAVAVTYGTVSELARAAEDEPVRVDLSADTGEPSIVTVLQDLAPVLAAAAGTRVYTLDARRESH
ncbi:hypothetical protein AB0M46_12610 [Dactylosporangium sp. NPDC051485]|uniref:hypothetical protein n=1 Tax=Dactylosporangium sp. NPDC051485 TaxID=3154846 RepID=UPI00341C746A